MKKMQTKGIWLLVAQILLLSLIMLSPALISYISSGDSRLAMQSFWITCIWLAPTMGVYLLNFYLCIPLLWFRHRFWQFGLTNAVLITVGNLHLINNNISAMPDYARAGFSSFMIISFLLCLMAVGIALSIRYMMRRSERRQKEVEAELAWLKNQINPHFLFNTLNNISSLAQIDGEETQEAIMQLSDLLRYAMYETNKPKVRLDGEVEFMRNYIELMKLRCNEMTTVNAQFIVQSSQLEVAPLLFISLIENAFKHGMNSNAPATIDISLTQQGNTLVFLCDNTNNPKPTKDRSGSGIGLENTRRRLDLLYAGRYTWEQKVTPENIYHVKITICL
ncbi:MAG: sensor histidine kinase [Prevotella sp.]|nr:sensor histidine kinase [Prevotella sp.]